MLTRSTEMEVPELRVRASTAPVLPIDIVDHWGMHSFPASDPPANW